MKKSSVSRYFIIGAVSLSALLSIVIIFVLLLQSGSKSTQVPPGAIATVAGQEITRNDYQLVLSGTKSSYRVTGKKFPVIGSKDYETLKEQLVAYLVEYTEKSLAAKSEFGIVVSAVDAENSYNQFVKSVGGAQVLEKQLKQQGLTHSQLRFTLKNQLLEKKIVNRLMEDVKISPNAAKEYYTKNKLLYKLGASRELSHILVKTKIQAEKIYQQLLSGFSFTKLAKKYSIDTSSGINGGSLGVTEKTKLVAAFANAAFALKTGAISPPTKSQYGWHIIRADGPIIAAHTQSFASVKQAIGNGLAQQEQQKLSQEWFDKVKKQYTKRVHYAVGFSPEPTTTLTSATTTTA